MGRGLTFKKENGLQKRKKEKGNFSLNTSTNRLTFKRKMAYRRKKAHRFFTCRLLGLTLLYLFTCLLQVKALFYDDEQTYDAEIVAETKLGFKFVFTEYGNDQVIYFFFCLYRVWQRSGNLCIY